MHEAATKSILELEVDDGELRNHKHQLSLKKHEIQGRLSVIKMELKSKILPKPRYLALLRERTGLIQELAGLEGQLGAINAVRAETLTVLEVRKRQAGQFLAGEVRKLVELRDRWHDYSMDADNHQKAREAAWKFTQELRAILKDHFDSQPPG